MNIDEKENFKGTIRPLKEEDLPTLKVILEMWIRRMDNDEIIPEEVETDLALFNGSLGGNGKKILVAEAPAGRVIGVMGLTRPKDELKPYFKTDKPSELITAYVDREFRGGRGVGTALINAIQDLSRSQGAKEILLESGPRYRRSGHGFYDKQPGFERVGILKDFYGPRFDSVVWRKIF